MAKTKTSQNPKAVNLSRPFLGLRSFEEQNNKQFGGRDQEIDKLFQLVEDNGLTVVFGTSGIGKTSLLKAGLMPKLRQKFYFPIYIRIDYSSKKSPLLQLKDMAYNAMLELDPSIAEIKSFTLWEYLHDVKLLNGLVKPVLILDQFEEIFTLGKGKDLKNFYVELGDFCQNRIPKAVKDKYRKQGKTVPSHYSKQSYHTVISLREDYLARLDELKNYIPSIMDNGFRVVQMTVSQAMEAAEKPGKGLIDQTVAKEIVNKLLKEQDANDKDLMVEPFLLSFICDQLNEKRIEMGLNEINKKMVANFKMEDAISSFYNEALKKFGPDVTLAIENRLLNSEGYRKLFASTEFKLGYDITDNDIDGLVDARIIRKESRNNVEYLELIHDVLAPVIKKKKDVREAKERKEQKAKEDEARSNRRFRIILVSVGALVTFLGVKNYLNSKELKQTETDIWNFALETNTANVFKSYLKNFPDGKEIESAKRKVDMLLWREAVADSTKEAFNNYKSEAKFLKSEYEYNAIYVDSADIMIKTIDFNNGEAERLEKIAWDNATGPPSFNSYMVYIMNPHRTKENLERAIERIKDLGITGILYAGDTNNGKVSKRIYDFVPQQNKTISSDNDMPTVGDVIKAKGTRNTYILTRLSDDSRRLDRNQKAWEIFKNAYVLGVIENKGALFLQIIYEK